MAQSATAATVSMTGFAAAKGQGLGFQWAWDIRSVNGKGLELRLRLPDWVPGLELALRATLQQALARGNVSLNLRLTRSQEGGESAIRVNPEILHAVLAALHQVENAAMAQGVTLAQPNPADVLGFRGVIDTAPQEEDPLPLRDALIADFAPLLAAFMAMRAAEGAALARVIRAQLAQIGALVGQARHLAEARRATAEAQLREGVARLIGASEGLDAGRLAQELALLAVKQDVTEELDRLDAHVAAAALLLDEPGAVGRKFDFLMQEFMREANTLCSKAQALELTRIGLDLKTLIDQMREQVQNVE